jgi:Flp pilus assembly protein TadD
MRRKNALHHCRASICAVVLLCVSCAHQSPIVSHGVSRTAVATVMARQVQNAVDAGDGDLEARTLRQRLAADAQDLDARLALARLYARRGLPELALEHHRLAEAQFPDSVPVTLGLAKTLREMGEAEAALRAIQDFQAKHTRGSWELLSLQGILEDEQGRFGMAETAHRAALALDPGRSALHNNLGYNLLLQAKADAAAGEFRRALELDPRSEIAHNNLGAALALDSQPARAPAFKEALEEWQRLADPAAAHNNLAAVLMEQGRYAEARSELETALGFRRDFPAALANLKLIAELDGRPVLVPPPRQPVNLWKRATSTLGRVVVGIPAPKAPSSGASAAGTVSPNGEAATPAEEAGNAPVSAAGKE